MPANDGLANVGKDDSLTGVPNMECITLLTVIDRQWWG